nr:MAG TPA: minor capsid protein [Microviridae sp.]
MLRIKTKPSNYCSIFGVDDVALALGAGSGLDIVGGQLSAAQNRQSQRAAADLSREFAKNGIQWKVADAKAAGLHPLYALGGIPAQSNPIAIGDTTAQSFSDAGQNLARAASMGVSQDSRNRMELENQLLMSQIGESDARKEGILAETAIKKQANLSSIGIQPETGFMADHGQSPVTPGAGVIDVKPSEIISSSQARPSMEAGIRPGEEQRLIGGMPILLPQLGGESSEEIISEMSPLSWAGLLARNSKIYGKGWIEDFLRMRYLGQESNLSRPPIQASQGTKDYFERTRKAWHRPSRLETLPEGVRDATKRAMDVLGEYKRKYPRWSREHPSGRR